MDDVFARFSNDNDRGAISRRRLLQVLGAAAVTAPLTSLAQGRCMTTFGTRPATPTRSRRCSHRPVGRRPSLDHITFRVADYQKEAAFYVALMGWKLRSDDGKQACWTSATGARSIFKQAPPAR